MPGCQNKLVTKKLKIDPKQLKINPKKLKIVAKKIILCGKLNSFCTLNTNLYCGETTKNSGKKN